VLASFAGDPHALLLATDAAAEGLNLHHHCRLVVNLELPWNPMRLEQRIGRVDRIGQRRTVHAFHLIASGTGESRLLARLRARVASAQAEFGAPDPCADDERQVAQRVIAEHE
jgi:SNF2 family DNA or RNA helicase